MPFAAIALASSLVIQLPWMNAPTAGTTYDSTTHQGAVFILEAYQLRCAPCNDNAPRFAAVANAFSSDPRAQFVELGLDTTDRDYTQWIARYHPQHPVLKDANHAVWGPLGGTGTPTTWILDCHMDVAWTHVGALGDDGQADLQAAVESALAAPCN